MVYANIFHIHFAVGQLNHKPHYLLFGWLVLNGQTVNYLANNWISWVVKICCCTLPHYFPTMQEQYPAVFLRAEQEQSH